MTGTRRYRKWRAGVWILATIAAMLTVRQAAPAYGNTLEDAVKATYLYKFAPFVEWPPTAYESPTSPLVFCVVADAAFADLLDRAVQDQRLGERALTVRRLRSVDRNSDCHVLYLTGPDEQGNAEILAGTRGQPVLSVTDEATDPQARGVINFVIRGDRVRFEIDMRAAAANGIAISSKLLSLAVAVQGQS